MIKALRVDHRLLHGQVAFSWTQALGADCILLASDDLIKDSLKLNTIKLAKPEGVKVVSKSINGSIEAIEKGVTDKYKLFIICETIKDAATLARKFGINEINLGGTLPTSDKKKLGKAVYVNDEEIELLKDLESENIRSFIQGVPSSNAVYVSTIL